MDVGAYLARIGFEGAARPDLDTLTRLHRAHLSAIPYENLDVMLGRPGDTSAAHAFDKLVTRQRGGWCYEMNGVLAWALDEIGFRVTRVAGAVHRTHLGDEIIGNHLVLIVHLDHPYLADVGFGDGLFDPVPLKEGLISQHGFDSRLVCAADGFWRYHNHQNGGAPTFDFRAEPAAPELLARMCQHLRTSMESPFTQNVVLQRRYPGHVEILRNSLRLSAYPGRLERRKIADADDFMREINTVFGVDEPEARTLWPWAQQRGEIMLKDHPL